MATSTTEIDEEIREHWRDLHKELHPLIFSSEQNVLFENDKLLSNLRSLQNDAKFSPLIARDIMRSNNDFAISSQQNTWQIVFNDEWQTFDDNTRSRKFDSWCKRIHRSPEYSDIMDRFDIALEDWQFILCLDDDPRETAWFRPPSFPSTLSYKNAFSLPKTTQQNTLHSPLFFFRNVFGNGAGLKLERFLQTISASKMPQNVQR